MPHFRIEDPAALEGMLDEGGLCDERQAWAASIDTLLIPGIRMHVARVHHVAMTDSDSKHGNTDPSTRLCKGRTVATKRTIIAHSSNAFSAEMFDIDPEPLAKRGYVRDYQEDPI